MTEQTEAATPVEAKPARIVEMQDGSKVDFGSRSKLLVSFSTEDNTATFKVFTGDMVTWVVEGMDNLTDFQKIVYMYGLVERVKSSLSPISLKNLASTIHAQIAEINKGNFNIRANGGTKVATGLDQLQTAYALAMAELKPEVAHWNQVTEQTVIDEVLASWATKDAKQRGAIRRHPAVSLKLSMLKLEAGEGDEELLAV